MHETVLQGCVPLSILQTCPKREQQPPRSLESEIVPEPGFGYLLTDEQQVFAQPMSSSAGMAGMPMTQRPFGMSNHSWSEATLSPPLNVLMTGVLGTLVLRQQTHGSIEG